MDTANPKTQLLKFDEHTAATFRRREVLRVPREEVMHEKVPCLKCIFEHHGAILVETALFKFANEHSKGLLRKEKFRFNIFLFVEGHFAGVLRG